MSKAIAVQRDRDPLIDLGELIRGARRRKGLSMDELAKMTGISRAYLGFIERGENSARSGPPRPSLENLTALAEALNADLDSWLPLAGLPSQRLTTATSLSDAAIEERFVKPGAFLNLENTERDLTGFLEENVLAEVPTLVAIRGIQLNPDIRIVGVSSRAGPPLAYLAELAPNSPHIQWGDSELRNAFSGKAVCTYGWLTDATAFLVYSLNSLGIPWRLSRVPDFPENEPLPRHPDYRGRGEGGCDIYVAYSTGALVYSLGLAKSPDFKKLLPFEVAAVQAHPYVLRRPEWQLCRTVYTLDRVWPNYSWFQFPSTVIVALAGGLDDDTKHSRIAAELKALQRANQAAIARLHSEARHAGLPGASSGDTTEFWIAADSEVLCSDPGALLTQLQLIGSAAYEGRLFAAPVEIREEAIVSGNAVLAE